MTPENREQRDVEVRATYLEACDLCGKLLAVAKKHGEDDAVIDARRWLAESTDHFNDRGHVGITPDYVEATQNVIICLAQAGISAEPILNMYGLVVGWAKNPPGAPASAHLAL